MRSVSFDGISVGEISVNFMEQPPKIQAKAAFISRKTGQTHGWTTCHQWSTETAAKLKELRASMEQDLEALHFADSASAVESSTTTMGSGGLSNGFKGLGEQLGSAGDDVPQT